MAQHGSTTDLDPFLAKESLDSLAKIGYGKRRPRLGPHRYHGIAARTRLSVAGKRAMVSTSEQRRQHHKERVTINQVNDLAEIAREIDSFTKAGLRVPAAVWEKYDRINKRHKKHEDMLAVAAGERSKTTRKRGAGEDEEQGHPQGSDERKGTCKPNQERENSSNSCNRGHQPSTEHASFSPSSAANSSSSSSSSSSTTCQNKPIRRTAPAPFQGGRCTFGTRTGNDEGDALDTLARRRKHASKAIMGNDPHCSWGPQERAKLNEIYWELGRPPRRGAGAEREHFFRYTQRHCMVYPNRSPHEVIERLKLMFRYNGMKEPNEREHWLQLRAKRGFFPSPQENAAGTPESLDTAVEPTKAQQPVDFSTLEANPKEKAGTSEGVPGSHEPPSGGSEGLLFRRSGGGPGGETPIVGGRGLLSAAAASYAAEAIKTASLPSSSTRPPRSHARASGAVSPFHDPVRPNSPAWGFGEASPLSSFPAGSRGGSRGSSRGGSRGGSRGASAGAGGFHNDDGDGPEETELLDYTSLGAQTVSTRATSPAFAFSREGLGSENLCMFQADKRPEPGPGSFRPNLSATSTHPGPRCGVLIGGRLGSRVGGSGGGAGSSGGAGAAGMAAGGGVSSTTPGPGPGQYSTWDAIGRQILSTRPSSPIVTFATGDWELR